MKKLINITERKCSKCNKVLPIKAFCKNNSNTGNKSYICRNCSKVKIKEFRTSKRGVIVIIYDSQKRSSKLRNMTLPNYSLEDLYTYCISQLHFDSLYKEWVKSNYQKNLKPSIDRLDDNKPYTLDNIRLVSFQENLKHAMHNKKYGISTQGKYTKKVIQLDKQKNFIKEYPSASIASKEVPNTNRQNIQKVCLGERKYCGNYIWKYKSKV